VWLLGTLTASLGGLVVAWAVRRRIEREWAAECDRRARDAYSARAEAAQARRGRPDTLVVEAATAIVDNAIRGLATGREA
jgi:hypothetical protein